MITTSTRVEDAELAVLLERVEKAGSGPDHDLDRDLCLGLNYIGYVDAPLNLRCAEDGWLDYECVEDGHAVQCSDLPPNLTGSIDAALALAERMLPGLPVLMGYGQTPRTKPWARVGAWKEADATGASLPLAILAAALRSLSQGAGHEQ